MDIFIKTYHKDFEWLYYCVKSIHKFAKGFRKIIIVSDNDGHKIPENIQNIMPLYIIYLDVPTTIPNNMIQPIGYVWQQLIKISWMNFTDAESILLLDSDEMLSKPLTPSNLMDENGNFYWFYRDWELSENAICWKIPTSIFLKKEPKYEAMCVSGFVFEKETTKRLIDYITTIHNTKTVWDIFYKNYITEFSEYNTYGNFIHIIDEKNTYNKQINVEDFTSYYTYNIIKSWSYGGLNGEDKEIRDNILK